MQQFSYDVAGMLIFLLARFIRGGGFGKAQSQQGRRIQILAPPANCQVEMCTGCTSGGATDSNFLSTFDAISFFHQESREMQVKS